MASGFTLIELLVVITIIVILLALLTPALDKAIYQAELTVCATKQRAVATGAINYAFGNKRSYPFRPGVRDDTLWVPALLYNGNTQWRQFQSAWYAGTAGDEDVYDDRPMLRSFLNLNQHLNDPLTEALDYEDIDRDSWAYATYAMWFGYKIVGYKGMKRVGDRWTWSDVTGDYRFRILVSDRDVLTLTGEVQSGHQDKAGITYNFVLQNEDFNGLGFKTVQSLWFAYTERGPSDFNYAMDDGSVERYTDITHFDPEMGRAPVASQGDNAYFETLPPQR